VGKIRGEVSMAVEVLLWRALFSWGGFMVNCWRDYCVKSCMVQLNCNSIYNENYCNGINGYNNRLHLHITASSHHIFLFTSISQPLHLQVTISYS
jgi:hypothetical protein